VSRRTGAAYSAGRIAKQVAALGRRITKDYKGRRLDVVITFDRGFVFAADLIRRLSGNVVCHFVPAGVRDLDADGRAQREIFFGSWPDVKGRDVLVVDAVLDSGVTQEFILRRLGESRPRSLRLAVLLDKPGGRRVDLEPDYFAFQTASNGLWVGYGLSAANGSGRNLPNLVHAGGSGRGKSRGKK